MTHNIRSMPRASYLEDGSRVELEFEDESGESITLGFRTSDFERFVGRAVQLVTQAQNQKQSIGDHLAVHVVPAVAAAAQAPVGGDKIVLMLRGNNGLPYLFALEPDVAEQLRPELHRAAKSARKQASESRH